MGQGASRRLLVVSCFFPPIGGGGVQRMVKLLRYLDPGRWQVDVLAMDPGESWVTDASLLAQIPASVRVHRVPSPLPTSLPATRAAREQGSRPDRLYNHARRLVGWFSPPDVYLPWALRARLRLRQLLASGSFDALVSTSPPDSAHLVVGRLARRHGLPWLVDFRDPWTQRLHYQPPTRLHRRLECRMERIVVEGADALVMVTEPMRRDFARRHPSCAAKMRTLTNGFDPADYPPSIPELDGGGPLRLVHTGTLTLRRNVVPLVETLGHLRKLRPGLVEHLRVDLIGSRDELNERLVREARLGDLVRFHAGLQHKAVIDAQRHAPALLLLDAAGPGSELTLPGKLFEYFGAQRPIFALASPEGSGRLLAETGTGVCFGPGEYAQAAHTLDAWISAWQAGRLRWLGNEEAIAPYRRTAIAARFAEILETLIDRG